MGRIQVFKVVAWDKSLRTLNAMLRIRFYAGLGTLFCGSAEMAAQF